MSSQKEGRQDQVAGLQSHWIPPACFHDKSSPFRGPRAVHSQQNVAVGGEIHSVLVFARFNQCLEVSAWESLSPDIGQIFEWGAAS